MLEGLKLDTGEIGDNERRGTMKGRDLIKPGGIQFLAQELPFAMTAAGKKKKKKKERKKISADKCKM